MTFGGLVLGLIQVATDEAIAGVFPRLAVGMMFAGSAIIPVVLYLAGFELFAIGSVVYALPLLFGFWLLTRRLAIALLAVTDQFETRPLPDAVLKGFASPVPVYEVLAKRGP